MSDKPEMYNPPLGECPPWCQLDPGHDWEDEWENGPIRYHRWRVDVCKWHSIGLDEIEQVTYDGQRVRQRELVLDVEAPTQWDFDTAVKGIGLIGQAMNFMAVDLPDGEVR